MIYPSLDVQVTLRCNAACRNCIKLCNMGVVTGLDYSDTDITLEQAAMIQEELLALAAQHGRPIMSVLCLTGGEPLLHPQIRELAAIFAPLVPVVADMFMINTNGSVEMPELSHYAATYTPLAGKAAEHNVVLLHPSDIEDEGHTFETCQHFRKWRPVVNVYGYSMCCAGDGYIRLMGVDDAITPHLPATPSDFPLAAMNQVCPHCPFGCQTQVFERDAGRPVSDFYLEQAARNRAGRRLTSRLGVAK